METLKTDVFPRGRLATYWLIFKQGSDRPKALTVDILPGGEALAVFSFEEEALLFLVVQGLTGAWTARVIAATELVSALLDSRPNHVALDPLPGSLGDKMPSLMTMPKERFLRDLVRKLAPATARPVSRRGE